MAKNKIKVSGTQLKNEALYTKKVQEDVWEVDIGEIEKVVSSYIDEAGESGKYSQAGFCLKLEITRDMLDAWRDGFFESNDVHDENVLTNQELAQCISMGFLHIVKYWEECDKASVQSKHVKMLVQSGALEEKKSRGIGTPPFDLGSLKKFSK